MATHHRGEYLVSNPRRAAPQPSADNAMDTFQTSCGCCSPHPEYEKAMADLERRAARGEVTLAQARHEIFALRERYTAGMPVAQYRIGNTH